jgi:DNA recombination-dependent growth factor C
MGFASRSVSVIRYRVKIEGEPPSWEVIHEGVRMGSFKEIESSGDIVAIGWTSVEDFTDTEFARGTYTAAEYVTLAFRIDSVRVPAKALELHTRTETRKLLEQTGRTRLSSAQRRELKESVQEKLRKQMLPNIQVFDLLWNTNDGIVYFGTHGIKARERMEDHFKKCFGPSLIPLIPYLRAEEMLTDAADRRRLEELRPAIMTP